MSVSSRLPVYICLNRYIPELSECRNVSSCFFEIGSQTQTSQKEATLVQMDSDSHHFELLLSDSCVPAG